VQTLDGFAEGIRRFVGGLAKKLLIANTLALPADQIFSLPAVELSTSDAWIGILCYTLQIYFDFSGYSDMAVGLGKMFGFTFLENFQFPYIARSLRDFWRRWHISLSTWFRDYLYVPLGGNRVSRAKTHLNLLIVFFLCGLWHGASLTFVIWGLYHGIFLVLERTRFGALQEKLPQSLRHLYTIGVVMMGWVIFRADSVIAAGQYFLALFGLKTAPHAQSYLRYTTYEVLAAILIGILFSGPVWATMKQTCRKLALAMPARFHPPLHAAGFAVEIGLIVGLFTLSAAWLASGTYNPFIYYRF
jgi:alginate O-acetyltransferase complex protein AlgI